MKWLTFAVLVIFCECVLHPTAEAGPYAGASGDPLNPYDAPIPSFIGPDGLGKAPIQSGVDIDGNPIYINANNVVNPIFQAWASSVVSYQPAPGIESVWKNPAKALGAVTGDNFDIVTLGDLYSPSNPPPIGSFPPFVPVGDPSRIPYSGNPADPNDGFSFIGYDAPGSITLGFGISIRNGTGADFAVFENGFISNFTTSDGSIVGQLFGELAYVEVSTNGVDFARFSSVSLTGAAVGPYGTIDPTDVYNLAGKSANAYGESWGTPFDLQLLVSDQDALAMMQAGKLDLESINYIRLVDIPGDGSFKDSQGNSIYDAWRTFGSGGFDLDAVGAINVVPEPSAGNLLLLAAAGFMARRRRR